jgi:hypothetical protein
LKGVDWKMEKTNTSMSWETFWRKKLKRLAHIMGTTESQLSQDAFQYYVENSNVTKEAMKKINEQDEFISGLKPKKFTQLKNGVEYRPYISEEDDR